MPSFEVDFEIKGLKLKIKGERNEVPMILDNVARQVSGAIAPMAAIAQAGSPPILPEPKIESLQSTPSFSRRTVKGRRSGGTGSKLAAVVPIAFHHDAQKYGSPKQAWKGERKIAWMMHVLHKETNVKAVSGAQIAETFNEHFRAAGQLHRNSMPRDLNHMKDKAVPWVGKTKGESATEWFLTDEGHKEALSAIADATSGEAV